MDITALPALGRDFYLKDTVAAARELVGHVLVHETAGGLITGRIVETEAYVTGDPASHAWKGLTNRNRAMFGPPGHAYIYMIHTHWCLNAVTMPEGVGEAVLIRALEPLEGVDLMMESRRTVHPRALCSGPGKLTQALRIDKSLDGADLLQSPLRILEYKHLTDLVQTTRIGISTAVHEPWRFYSRELIQWVSKK